MFFEMMHTMSLTSEWFKNIVDGKKSIEGRLYDDKRKKIDVGDKICFSCGEEKCVVVVKRLTTYANFKELLEEEGVEKVLPGETVDSLVYENIYGKNTETVVAIEFEKVFS